MNRKCVHTPHTANHTYVRRLVSTVKLKFVQRFGVEHVESFFFFIESVCLLSVVVVDVTYSMNESLRLAHNSIKYATYAGQRRYWAVCVLVGHTNPLKTMRSHSHSSRVGRFTCTRTLFGFSFIRSTFSFSVGFRFCFSMFRSYSNNNTA